MPSASLVTNMTPDYTRVFSGQWRLDASVPDYTRGLHDQHGQWLEQVRQSGAWAMALPWISLVIVGRPRLHACLHGSGGWAKGEAVRGGARPCPRLRWSPVSRMTRGQSPASGCRPRMRQSGVWAMALPLISLVINWRSGLHACFNRPADRPAGQNTAVEAGRKVRQSGAGLRPCPGPCWSPDPDPGCGGWTKGEAIWGQEFRTLPCIQSAGRQSAFRLHACVHGQWRLDGR